MSHKLEVPKGWTRGESLVIRRSENTLVLSQNYKPFDPDKIVSPLDIAYVTFKGKKAHGELAAFLKWWLS